MPFQNLPTPTNGVSSNERVNGEARFVKDNSASGSGDLFGFLWSDSQNSLDLIVSANNGQSWNKVATSTSLTPYRVMALAQDSAGRVHVISYAGTSDSGSYLRITLSYTNSHISGFTVATPIALPNHNRTSTQLRADIKLVKNASGTETLVYSMSMSTLGSSGSGTDMKVYMAKATSLTPASSANFVGLHDSVSESDTLVFDSCVGHGSVCSHSPPDFTPHIHTALFAQNGISRDLYLFQGPIDADYAITYGDDSDVLYYTRLSSSANGWGGTSRVTPPTPVAIATNKTSGPGIQYGAELFSVFSGTSYAWVMYIDPINGIRFGQLDSSGNYAEPSGINSPDATHKPRNGGGVFTVSADDTKVWAVWNILADALMGGYSGGSYPSGSAPIAAEGYFNGSSWTVYNDPGAYDLMGVAGVSGWTNGTAAILIKLNVATQQWEQPTAAAIWTNP